MTKIFTAQLQHTAEHTRNSRKPPRVMQPLVDPAQVGQQITQILVNSLDSETLLSDIARVFTQGFDAGGTAIAILDSDKRDQNVIDWHFHQGLGISQTNPPAIWECPILSRRLLNSKPLMISDLHQAKMSASIAEHCREANVRSILAIETRYQGQIVGVIVLMKAEVYHWTGSEIDAFKMVAQVAAIAMAQVKQAQSIHTLQQQTQTLVQQQALIARLTKVILNSLDLTEILQEAIEGITQTLQVTHGLVLLFKYPEEQSARADFSKWGVWEGANSPRNLEKAMIPTIKVTVVAQWHDRGSTSEKSLTRSSSTAKSYSNFDQAFWMSDCDWCQYAYTQTPKPLAIRDREEWFNTHPETKVAPIFQPEAISAVLLFPLIRSHERTNQSPKILGFLVLQHERSRTWNSEDLKLVEIVSTQLGNALLQTRILHQVQSLVSDRTAQLQRSLDVQAKLYEQSRRQVHQLRSLHQQTSEFLAAVSHELNTPLTSMGVAIEMLRQAVLTPERQATYLNILEQEWRREKKLVENLLMLQRLEAKETALLVESVNLELLISQVGQTFEYKWAHKDLKLSIELPRPAFKIKSDSDSLKTILEELLTNAGKYSHPGTTAICHVSEQVQHGVSQVVITVTNFGSEIPSEDLPHIFDPFRRRQGATQEAIPGTGLGLALVRGLVQLLYGEISVACQVLEDQITSEINFILTLPQNLENLS